MAPGTSFCARSRSLRKQRMLRLRLRLLIWQGGEVEAGSHGSTSRSFWKLPLIEDGSSIFSGVLMAMIWLCVSILVSNLIIPIAYDYHTLFISYSKGRIIWYPWFIDFFWGKKKQLISLLGFLYFLFPSFVAFTIEFYTFSIVDLWGFNKVVFLAGQIEVEMIEFSYNLCIHLHYRWAKLHLPIR